MLKRQGLFAFFAIKIIKLKVLCSSSLNGERGNKNTREKNFEEKTYIKFRLFSSLTAVHN